MALSVNLNVSCFCIITGASQGIGRALAIEFSKHMGKNSVILLMARNLEGLELTKSLMNCDNIKVIVKSVDLSSISTLDMKNCLKDIVSDCKQVFDLHLIIHNAGSIGDPKLSAAQLDDVEQWRKYFDLNVFNVSALNSVFLKQFEQYEEQTVVINITSKCGIEPFAGLSQYGSGKAAREMYFRVLAVERPKLKVLNYSPGPVHTAMVDSIVENTFNMELKSYFQSSKEARQILQPEQTAKKCVNVVMEGNYSSGDHVDYYD